MLKIHTVRHEQWSIWFLIRLWIVNLNTHTVKCHRIEIQTIQMLCVFTIRNLPMYRMLCCAWRFVAELSHRNKSSREWSKSTVKYVPSEKPTTKPRINLEKNDQHHKDYGPQAEFVTLVHLVSLYIFNNVLLPWQGEQTEYRLVVVLTDGLFYIMS